MNHVLKCHAEHFDHAWEGRKLFEVRVDDRSARFEPGDRVYLVEWDPAADAELPRWLVTIIIHVTRPPVAGLGAGYCVLGLDPHMTCSYGRWSESATCARLGERSGTVPRPAGCRWFCACGWSGEAGEMPSNASGVRVCPQCGGSDGLDFRYPDNRERGAA